MVYIYIIPTSIWDEKWDEILIFGGGILMDYFWEELWNIPADDCMGVSFNGVPPKMDGLWKTP